MDPNMHLRFLSTHLPQVSKQDRGGKVSFNVSLLESNDLTTENMGKLQLLIFRAKVLIIC